MGTVVLAAVIAGIGWAPSAVVLAVALMAVGLVDAVVDVAQNVAGVRVQERLSRSILSSMHAFWSLGAVAGAAGGTLAAANGVDIRLHLGLVAVAMVILVAVGTWLTGPVPADPAHNASGDAAEERRGAGRRAGTAMWLALPVALVALSGTTVEDMANNWSALAAVEFAGIDVSAAGAAFTVVLAAQCLGRFTGDRLIDRFGRVRVARAGGVLISLGGLLIVTATSTAQLYAGLVLVGFGCATLVPSAFAAAARIPGVSEGAGVTAVSWLMRVSFLATSPLVGAVSEATNLRWALGLLILVGGVVAAFAPALRDPSRARAGT
ncbi:MFS transporter [Corynebacterium suedekumii]|nr:MFS transporter [Corynebacterium suedekumii]